MAGRSLIAFAAAALAAGAPARAQDERVNVAAADIGVPASTEQPFGFHSDGTSYPRTPWIDRVQRGVYETVYLSAMRIDSLFGPLDDERIYEASSGSVAPALLWDERRGFRPKLRFRVNLPLPRLDERFNAFVGRVNRDEYVAERLPQTGALPERPRSFDREDQTLLGIGYQDRNIRHGWRFDADGGVRVRFPLDPYVKAGYNFESGRIDGVRLSLRETLFWQNSEEWGFTSRIDLDRFFRDRVFLRWTAAGTVTEISRGVRGYTEFYALMALPNRRAIAWSADVYGETDAPEPWREFGTKLAYRQSIARQWLVLELRTSVTWPKDMPGEPRSPNWGVGLGLEMFFGTDEFLARPVTF